MKTAELLKYIKPNVDNAFIWLTAVLMVGGLYFLDWEPKVIIFAYIFETVVIGVIHIGKMATTALLSKKMGVSGENSRVSGVFLTLFYCVHYFMFVSIQIAFVLIFMGDNAFGADLSFSGLFTNFIQLFSQTDMREVFLLIILNNVYFSVKSFFLPKKFLETTPSELMFQPYIRVFVQQFLVTLGGFIFIITGGPLAVALLLIALKTIIDLVGNAVPRNPKLTREIIDRMKKINKKEGKELSKEELEKGREFINKMFE